MGKHSKGSQRETDREQAIAAALARGDDPAELASWKGGRIGREMPVGRGGENLRDRVQEG